ncbi:MAG: hypothetical protein ABL916_24325 [Burkholderiaceae bacterium]
MAPTLKPGALAETSRKLNELARLDSEAELRTLELARKLGYDGPLDPDVIERGVVNQMRRTVEACLETGRMLLVLKERVGHGDFVKRVKRLGVEYTLCTRFMQGALKWPANIATSQHLIASIGNQSKFLELIVLDQEQLEELGTEGSVLGIELDEVDVLSVSGLRARLRDVLQERDGARELATERSNEVDELKIKLKKPYKPKPDAIAKTERQATLQRALSEQGAAAQVAIVQLATVANDVMDEFDGTALSTFARECLEFVANTLAELSQTHNIQINMAQKLDVPWLKSSVSELCRKG